MPTSDDKSRQPRFNKKVVIGIMLLALGVAFIFVTSWFPFIIDPSKWGSKEFITDELITAAIVIFGMVSVLLIALASNSADPKSEIAKARSKFIKTCEAITERRTSEFKQWIKDVFQPKDIESIKRRKLMEIGIDDPTILDLEIDEIKGLTKPLRKEMPNGEIHYYKSLGDEQIKALLSIRTKGVSIRFVDPMYYLTTKNISVDRTTSEKVGSEDSKKASFIVVKVIGRVIFTAIFGMVTAMLVYDISQDGAGGATAAYKFIQRMFNLCTSSFMGYTLGCQVNDIDAYYITLRINVHQEFLADNHFIAKTEQQLAKEEYEKTTMKEE